MQKGKEGDTPSLRYGENIEEENGYFFQRIR